MTKPVTESESVLALSAAKTRIIDLAAYLRFSRTSMVRPADTQRGRENEGNPSETAAGKR